VQVTAAAERVANAPDGPALDLHEGLSDPRPTRCDRWPENLALLSSDGELVRGRCKATNQCDYCARLAAVENTEMLALDAMEGNAPEVWCVLTTRTATVCMKLFYEARRQVMKALRRRWPSCQYASLLEFTTGYSARSGGQRRPHWNLLLKGIPAAECATAEALIKRVWCGQVDASPAAQYVGVIAEAGGLMRYIALHFQKESQSPPEGFSGQRFNCSRGYFDGVTRAEARAEARDSLFEKRALRRALMLGLDGDQAEDHVDREWVQRINTSWRLYDPRSGIKRLAGDRNPAQGAPVRSEGPSVARECRRLEAQPGGGEGPSPGQVDPPKPPGVLIVTTTATREGVSNGRCDSGPGDVPYVRSRDPGPG